MKKSKIYKYSKEELQKILDNHSSYIEIIRFMGFVGSSNITVLKRIIKEYNLSTEQLEENRKKRMSATTKKQNHRKTALEVIANKSKIPSHRLKQKLIEDGLKEERCECCKLTTWCGNKIPLELHHKDGDHNNNDLDNLEILCPNCHAQTSTYKGKNNKK